MVTGKHLGGFLESAAASGTVRSDIFRRLPLTYVLDVHSGIHAAVIRRTADRNQQAIHKTKENKVSGIVPTQTSR